jgi:hypothetical protein
MFTLGVLSRTGTSAPHRNGCDRMAIQPAGGTEPSAPFRPALVVRGRDDSVIADRITAPDAARGPVVYQPPSGCSEPAGDHDDPSKPRLIWSCTTLCDVAHAAVVLHEAQRGPPARRRAAPPPRSAADSARRCRADRLRPTAPLRRSHAPTAQHEPCRACSDSRAEVPIHSGCGRGRTRRPSEAQPSSGAGSPSVDANPGRGDRVRGSRGGHGDRPHHSDVSTPD